jgi:hypothetical protein
MSKTLVDSVEKIVADKLSRIMELLESEKYNEAKHLTSELRDKLTVFSPSYELFPAPPQSKLPFLLWAGRHKPAIRVRLLCEDITKKALAEDGVYPW